jgi:hypothetical protein
VVTILAGGTENAGAISTPNLLAGSVTVLKAPSAETFTLNLGASTLTLNKGYKLQDIKITSSIGSGSTAVLITHPTAGLASVEVKCTGSDVICVKVTGSGSHTLKDVTVDVEDNNASNIGILVDANANLSIVGGIVKLTAVAPTSQQPITLIQADGVLAATGLTVDMTGGATGIITNHTQNSIGIVLNAAGSSVTNSTIKVNKCTVSTGGTTVYSIGINVQHTTGKSTVVGNNFKGYNAANNCEVIGVKGGNRLSPSADFPNNNFLGIFTDTVDP